MGKICFYTEFLQIHISLDYSGTAVRQYFKITFCKLERRENVFFRKEKKTQIIFVDSLYKCCILRICQNLIKHWKCQIL